MNPRYIQWNLYQTGRMNTLVCKWLNHIFCRLVKGDGEILEEIVSKERHKEINKVIYVFYTHIIPVYTQLQKKPISHFSGQLWKSELRNENIVIPYSVAISYAS